MDEQVDPKEVIRTMGTMGRAALARRVKHAICPDDSITEVSELEELADEERQVSGNYGRHCDKLEKQLAEAEKELKGPR